MIRFVLRRNYKDQHNGLQSESLHTVDMDLPELERLLCRGGMSESGYDW